LRTEPAAAAIRNGQAMSEGAGVAAATEASICS